MKDGFGVEHISKAQHHHARKLLKEIIGEVAGQGYSTTKRRAKKSRVSKAKLPRLKRLTVNQPHNNDAADTIIHNGRALKDPAERMQAMGQMNHAARMNRFFSPYRVKFVPASGGAKPLQPTGPGARTSDTVFIERKHAYEIPAVQVGAGAMTAGAVGGGVYALHRKSKVAKSFVRIPGEGLVTRTPAQLKALRLKPARHASMTGTTRRDEGIRRSMESTWAAFRPITEGHGGRFATVPMKRKQTAHLSPLTPDAPMKGFHLSVPKPGKGQREAQHVIGTITQDEKGWDGATVARRSEVLRHELGHATSRKPLSREYRLVSNRKSWLEEARADSGMEEPKKSGYNMIARRMSTKDKPTIGNDPKHMRRYLKLQKKIAAAKGNSRRKTITLHSTEEPGRKIVLEDQRTGLMGTHAMPEGKPRVFRVNSAGTVTKRLKPSTLLKWGDGQARSPERVARVKAAIQESGRVDPVAVNIIRGKPHLMNGHHRAIAADDLGFKRIPVRVRFGPYKAWKDSVNKGMRLPNGARIRFRTVRSPNGTARVEARGAQKRIDDGGSRTRGIGYLRLGKTGEISMIHVDNEFKRQHVATNMIGHAVGRGVRVKPSAFRTDEGEALAQGFKTKYGIKIPDKRSSTATLDEV